MFNFNQTTYRWMTIAVSMLLTVLIVQKLCLNQEAEEKMVRYEDDPSAKEGQDWIGPNTKRRKYTTNGKIAINQSDYLTSNLIRVCADIQRRYGFVIVQLLNYAYINMTKSWICNLEQFDDVMQRVVFIATDQTTYDELFKWRHSLNVVFAQYGSENALRWGHVSYFKYCLFRAQIIDALLNHNISVLMTESDAVWFSYPLHAFKPTDEAVDMIVNSDKYEGGNGFCTCLLFLNATTNTRRVWGTLTKRLDQKLSQFTEEGAIRKNGFAQEMFYRIVMNDDEIATRFLPNKQFVSGQWYSSKVIQNAADPIILQNNFIAGNTNKIKRAIKWGHWFLSENASHCL
ncbi:uncharacterized protein LOC102804428 [Saccoglossus kowalevskii]|uniref:Uncharacterized protein LOC102804428 n=1 Tax=Saccoglossus kowalevskii TaxID=10224 RepID=A0ABM0MU81_SACKO|nr:PREDICTED: uncharacterized protein LOC102804428 [Saccoglossus kowalevskii]